MYLRGHEILYDALELKFPGFKKATVAEGTMQPILQKCKKSDVGFLYWSVAGGLAAYSIDIMDFTLSARISEWSAMIHRAYELNPDFDGAALDEFLLIFYASLPEFLGGDMDKAIHHYNVALEKTGGNSAGAYVSYAQNICVPAQDYDTYKERLESALAIDPNADKSSRLVNIINQRKAHWLLENAWTLFSFLPIPDNY